MFALHAKQWFHSPIHTYAISSRVLFSCNFMPGNNVIGSSATSSWHLVVISYADFSKILLVLNDGKYWKFLRWLRSARLVFRSCLTMMFFFLFYFPSLSIRSPQSDIALKLGLFSVLCDCWYFELMYSVQNAFDCSKTNSDFIYWHWIFMSLYVFI